MTTAHPYDAVPAPKATDYEDLIEPVLLATLDLSILVNEEWHRIAALQPHPATSAYFTELGLMRQELRENVRSLVAIGNIERTGIANPQLARKAS